MRVLIVAATQAEVEPIMTSLGMQRSDEEENLFVTGHVSVAN